MNNEVWKPIVGFEGLYEVSNLARIRSLDRVVTSRPGVTKRLKGVILKPGYTLSGKQGYMGLCLMKDGKKTNATVHRLVATAFIDNPDNKPCVNHIDGNKTNNALSNLEWVTYSENESHARDVLHKAYRGRTEQGLMFERLFAKLWESDNKSEVVTTENASIEALSHARRFGYKVSTKKCDGGHLITVLNKEQYNG